MYIFGSFGLIGPKSYPKHILQLKWPKACIDCSLANEGKQVWQKTFLTHKWLLEKKSSQYIVSRELSTNLPFNDDNIFPF